MEKRVEALFIKLIVLIFLMIKGKRFFFFENFFFDIDFADIENSLSKQLEEKNLLWVFLDEIIWIKYVFYRLVVYIYKYIYFYEDETIFRLK